MYLKSEKTKFIIDADLKQPMTDLHERIVKFFFSIFVLNLLNEIGLKY